MATIALLKKTSERACHLGASRGSALVKKGHLGSYETIASTIACLSLPGQLSRETQHHS